MSNQHIVDGEADSIVRNLTAGVGPDPTEDQRITRADIYDTQPVIGTRYMIGGGGPTSHAVVMPDQDGAPMVLIEVTLHSSERALRSIHGRVAQRIAEAFQNAQLDS